jgi:hypothetical protein
MGTIKISYLFTSLLFSLCSLVDSYTTFTREAPMKAEAGPAMLSHRPMMHILVTMLAIGTKTQSLPFIPDLHILAIATKNRKPKCKHQK